MKTAARNGALLAGGPIGWASGRGGRFFGRFGPSGVEAAATTMGHVNVVEGRDARRSTPAPDRRGRRADVVRRGASGTSGGRLRAGSGQRGREGGATRACGHLGHTLRPLRGARPHDARSALPDGAGIPVLPTPRAMTLRRRTFLKGAVGAAAATAGFAAGAGPWAPPVQAARDYDVPASLPVDRVVRTTCSPNCTGSCGQLAFVRDGVIVKIQQAADYPDAAYNPRGCMKGLSYLNQVYGPDRIMKPLIRTGPRGENAFREASWDEVLDHVAAELQRIGERWGWDSIHVFGQVPGSGYIQKGANYRACALLGMSHGTSFDFNGDLPMGMPITFGVQNAEHEARDWANSRFLLLVG
ncbi:MAG: twin-arginine translocation signal domain-containing protein, partial [Chloroflexi bacterium]|nr:twin-arginine translocation signal domain-containing protein [Chloroflexota bacterium]